VADDQLHELSGHHASPHARQRYLARQAAVRYVMSAPTRRATQASW
jgi:hypothetical protein